MAASTGVNSGEERRVNNASDEQASTERYVELIAKLMHISTDQCSKAFDQLATTQSTSPFKTALEVFYDFWEGNEESDLVKQLRQIVEQQTQA
jgi:hypothetical protein